MARPGTALGSLGARVSSGLEEFLPERQRAMDTAQRELMKGAFDPPVRRRSPVAWVSAVAAALSVAAVVAWVLVLRAPAPLAFNADGRPGELQTWLAAPEVAPIQLAFTDGSNVQIEPASRARVVDIDGHGASVALESGAIRAEVVHRSDSAWRVIAGPFTTRVTGTRFDVRWDAAAEHFTVEVHEGSVAVSGSLVGAERPVVAGEVLQVFVPERRMELRAVELTELGPEAAPSARSANAGNNAALDDDAGEFALPLDDVDAGDGDPSSVGSSAAAARRQPATKSAGVSALGGWREHAKRGALREAFAAAEASGFTGICSEASASELLLLGDAARVAGRADRATEALLALRQRFPSDSRRAAAAFALGKVAFDQRGAYKEAARWFATSVREQPRGSLVREASGRLMEALQKSGDSGGAKRAAREYLARYPGGPHADVARSLLR